MLKKHLKDTQSSLVMCTNIGPNVAIFKLYNTGRRLSKIVVYHNKLGRPQRTIIPIMDAIKLFNMGILSPLSNCLDIKYINMMIYGS